MRRALARKADMTHRPRESERSPVDVYLIRHGACAICRERDEARHHGASHCRGNFRRQHPRCASDGKRPRFEPDMAVIAQMER